MAKTKADALRAVADQQRVISAALEGLGGLARTADNWRSPLTWTARAARSVEHYEKAAPGRRRITHVDAHLDLTVSVRDFTLLETVSIALLDAGDLVNIQHVAWRTDDDNPVQREVRADAVRAAVQRGHDYAGALDGRVVRVEQLADVGLLEEPGPGPQAVSMAYASAARGSAAEDVPVLDPEPQQFSASIEARLIAQVPPIGAM